MTIGAKEYGVALYELASEEKAEQDILDSLQAVCTAFKENPMYQKILLNPAVDKTERLKLLDDSLRENVHKHVLNVCKILCEKKAIYILSDCLEVYRDMMYEQKGIMPVKAITAVKMSKKQENNLVKKLQESTGKTILLQTEVDESVIGGVKLIYAGKELDGTSIARLESMRNALTV